MYPYVKLNLDANYFVSSWERRLYEFYFVCVQKYVGEERGTICAHWNADYLFENLSPKDHEMLSKKNSSMLITCISSSVYLLLESEYCLTK